MGFEARMRSFDSVNEIKSHNPIPCKRQKQNFTKLLSLTTRTVYMCFRVQHNHVVALFQVSPLYQTYMRCTFISVRTAKQFYRGGVGGWTGNVIAGIEHGMRKLIVNGVIELVYICFVGERCYVTKGGICATNTTVVTLQFLPRNKRTEKELEESNMSKSDKFHQLNRLAHERQMLKFAYQQGTWPSSLHTTKIWTFQKHITAA